VPLAATPPTRPLPEDDDVLALTPEPLQTAGERAVFAELTRWDTGGSVRSAVVASLPMVDGPMGRRISDAVLFVPEGLAVVRIAAVPKQRGVVTAGPEGAWSIAPDARPGEVLQIAGGGSSPLDGLMRSGMEAAVRLRSAGLEPGRIARLTVLVGDLTGLLPADGDLGEGDQVALLEPRSLLLGIARAARYTGVDNPRLWTTADVRTALEVLGLPGRGPSVEELNGEGFPYSPYVLRRRELLTPAAMNAASAAAPPRASAAPDPLPVAARPVAPVTGGFVAPGPDGPRVDPAAAAAVAAAAIRADEAAAAHQAAVAARDVPAPAAPQPAAVPGGSSAAGAAAWFTPASPAPDQPAPRAWNPPTLPAGQPGPQPRSAPADSGVDRTDGIGGLFGGAEPTDPGSPGLPRTLVAPAVRAPAEQDAAERTASERPAGMPLVVARRRPDRTRRIAAVAGGAVLLIALIVVGLVLLLGGGDQDPDGSGTGDPTPTAAGPAQGSGPQVGDATAIGGRTFTLEAVQEDGTCVGHAYGDVADVFASGDCVGLARGLYSTEVDGSSVVVSISAVHMPDPAAATDLRALADRNGTGNVSDLLDEGTGYAGGPAELTDPQYASTVDGAVVTIVEAAWVEPGAGAASDLDTVAGTGLGLPLPDPTD
jgi:hypothetical protein